MPYGAENHYPYERPPLSKTFLRGETAFEEALVESVGFYRDHEIHVRFATRAMLSTSTGDQTYTNADSTINAWNDQRDALASQMIALLDWTGPGSSKNNESEKAKLIAQGRQLLAAVHSAAA